MSQKGGTIAFLQQDKAFQFNFKVYLIIQGRTSFEQSHIFTRCNVCKKEDYKDSEDKLSIHSDNCKIKDESISKFNIVITIDEIDYRKNIKNKRDFFKKQFVDQMFLDQENIKIFDYFYQTETHEQYSVIGKPKSSNHGTYVVCPVCERGMMGEENDKDKIIHTSECKNQFKVKKLSVNLPVRFFRTGKSTIELTLEKPNYFENKSVDIRTIPIEIIKEHVESYKCGICGQKTEKNSIEYDPCDKDKHLLIFNKIGHTPQCIQSRPSSYSNQKTITNDNIKAENIIFVEKIDGIAQPITTRCDTKKPTV